MEIGKLISKIRKDKNIPINQVINNQMSISTYVRFIEGKNQISINGFLDILNNLNLSFGEFEYIWNGYQNDILYRFNRNVMNQVLCGNLDRLILIENSIRLHIGKNNNRKYNKYFQLDCATNIFINILRNKKKLISDRKLKKINQPYIDSISHYLLKRYTWNYYEITLFNDVYFIFNINTIRFFYKRVVKDFDRYRDLNKYQNKGFRLLVNMLVMFIDNKDLTDASDLLLKLIKYNLREDMVMERLLLNFMIGIFELIQNNLNGIKLIKKSLSFLKFTKSKNYYLASKRYFNETVKRYNVNLAKLRNGDVS